MRKVSLVLILAACSPEIVPVNETGNTTTSPDGETSGESSSSTTTTTTSESGSESEGESTFTVFVPLEDFVNGQPCDPFVQDCPEGEKCVPYADRSGTWDSNKCVSVDGDGQPGEPCTYGGVVEATDDCDATSHCWETQEVDGQLVGICRAFCGGTFDNPMCAEGTACLIANQGNINLCLPTCDPIQQDCPDGQACTWGSTEFFCFVTQQDGSLGDPCDMSECGPGLMCAMAEVLPECDASACCGQFCSLSAPVCDWVGTECVSFWEGEPVPGYEDVGFCVVPQP